MSFFDPAEHDDIREHTRRILATGGPYPAHPRRLRPRGGGLRHLEVSAAAYDEVGTRSLHVALVDVTDRKRAEAALRDSLVEKEALLREVHHRVKNNLQVISSLLRLEAGRSGQPATVSVLDDMQHRILSMALLHETLYRSPASGDIDLGAYLSALVHQLFRLLTTADATSLTVDIAPAPVSMEHAIPCGLVVNELVSNALKHGRPATGRGAVTVSLQPTDDGAMRLEVRDNGRGLPADVEERRQHSLGLQLITDLARQLHGTAAWRTDAGTVATVTFTPRRTHVAH